MKTLSLAVLSLAAAAVWPAAAHPSAPPAHVAGAPPCADLVSPPTQGVPDMSYADRADLVDRFGADEIAQLAPEADGASPRADAALADAGAEIDAALAPAFALPLTGDWPALVSIQADMARARLYDESAPKSVRQRADRARRTLAGIVSGERWLLDGSGAPAPRRSAASFEGEAPTMTRSALRGV